MDRVFLFAGPSLRRNLQSVEEKYDITLLPPVRRGDIESLMVNYNASVIIIADGVFYQYPAVGHQEIRAALENSWEIWGVSSMGAIRAFEMKNFGMKGFGRVYEWFLSNPTFTDDEVTLLHSPIAPFHPLTEPMIHLRFALEDLRKKQIISELIEEEAVERLKKMYFGDRTISLLTKMLAPYLPHDVLNNWINEFDNYRVKTFDLYNILDQAPWKK